MLTSALLTSLHQHLDTLSLCSWPWYLARRLQLGELASIKSNVPCLVAFLQELVYKQILIQFYKWADHVIKDISSTSLLSQTLKPTPFSPINDCFLIYLCTLQLQLSYFILFLFELRRRASKMVICECDGVFMALRTLLLPKADLFWSYLGLRSMTSCCRVCSGSVLDGLLLG